MSKNTLEFFVSPHRGGARFHQFNLWIFKRGVSIFNKSSSISKFLLSFASDLMS
jgi:hypothetical protein